VRRKQTPSLFLDIAEVSSDGYVLAEEQGEMYFCNARCFCLWAVHFVTNPRRSEEEIFAIRPKTDPFWNAVVAGCPDYELGATAFAVAIF
jgi:hypothetical protein